MKKGNVSRTVKTPKGLWITTKDGASICVPQNEKVELAATSAETHVRRGNLYKVGEYEGLQAQVAAELEESQAEKAARLEDDLDLDDDDQTEDDKES